MKWIVGLLLPVLAVVLACNVDPITRFKIENPCDHSLRATAFVDLGGPMRTRDHIAGFRLRHVPGKGSSLAADDIALEGRDKVDLVVEERSGRGQLLEVAFSQEEDALAIQIPASFCESNS